MKNYLRQFSFFRLVIFLLFLSLAPLFAAEAIFSLDARGTGVVSLNGKDLFSVNPGYHLPDWRHSAFRYHNSSKTPNTVRTSSKIDGNEIVLDAVAENTADGVKVKYRLVPQKDIDLQAMHVYLLLNASTQGGYAVRCPGSLDMTWPSQFSQVFLTMIRNAPSVELDTPEGAITVTFEQPTHVLLQDNRQWTDTFEVRCGALQGRRVWSGGEVFEITMTISAEGGAIINPRPIREIQEDADWVPLDERLNVIPGSAIDFSGFGFTDGPAGKYGFVKAVGDHFEFADKPGVKQRFYGVNLCFSAHDLTHQQSEELAERLWRLGYNALRYHHYESVLQDLSNNDTTAVNPDAMERLDYLHNELRKRGIYLTTDTFVSRQVRASDVFDGETGNLAQDEVKMLLPVSDRMFENWKGFCRSFLGHRNPYTGLTYAEDPALAWISLVNEGNFGNYYNQLTERTRKLWIDAWKAWADKRYGDPLSRNRAWGMGDDYEIRELGKHFGTPALQRDFARFECETELKMLHRMKEFLRDELNCQALLTDMNCWTHSMWTQVARTEFDYVDDHFYVDHPRFLDQNWRLPSQCDNNNPVHSGLCGGGHVAFTRLLDKPFTITEYNFSAPGRFRGLGGIMLGCLAAIQDWSGLWRFAYSHSNTNMFQVSQLGYFDLATDPLNQCAERAAICLFLRGDLASAQQSVALTMPANFLEGEFSLDDSLAPGWKYMNTLAKVGYHLAPAGTALPEDITVGFSTDAPQGQFVLATPPKSQETGVTMMALFRQKGWLPADNLSDPDNRVAQSVSGQFVIDGQRDILTLDTPRTAGGFAPAGATLETAVAQFKVLDTDATVWVMSVDGQDIQKSHRLLVTHLTDLQNNHSLFASEKPQVLLSWGDPKHIVRKGRAIALLRLPENSIVTAWRIANDGQRLSQLPVRRVPQGIQLDLSVDGPHGAQLMYELLIEP